ncbi:MAG: ABC transporter ATP-binding protein [Gammaproteobacteria bacterium]
MSRETMISVAAVYRYYGEHCAVNNVSFTVERGEVLGFLGPNGAGKSTTMQIISGVITASYGSVNIAGIDIMDSPRAAKAQIGFLPEQPPLYADLTVDEYLRFAAQLRGLGRAAIAGAVPESKRRCGLEDSGRRLIRNLSKGFQQRVGIAQAIIHTPSVIILDEPTAGLDPIQIHEIRQLIRELGQDHSVILSTHILPEVQTVCNRVLIIHEGRLVLDKKLDSLQEDGVKQRLRIAFKQPPAVEALTAIEGMNKVEQLGARHFRISIRPDSSALDLLVQRSANSCWGLYEIMPETGSLEETFMRLTSSELPYPQETPGAAA